MASVSKREWTYKGTKKTAWIVRWKDTDSVHRQATFPSKKAADRKQLQLNNVIDRHGQVGSFDGKPLGGLFELFLRYHEDMLKDGRVGPERHKLVCRVVDTDLSPYLAKTSCTDLSAHEIEGWYSKLCRRSLAPGTAKNRVQLLSQILDYGVGRKLLTENPAREALKKLRKVSHDRVRTFTREQLMQLLRSLETRVKNRPSRVHNFIRCAVHIAAFCGLRRGEIFGLTRDDLNFEQRVIHVRHNLTPGDRLKDPKTRAGLRDVPMPDHLAKMLRAYLSAYYVKNERKLVFRSRDHGAGGKVSNNFYGIWLLTLESAGLLDTDNILHFHALRHFAASIWIEHGIPLTDVAQLIGHTRVNMTLSVYAHPMKSTDARRAVIEDMSSKLYLPPNFAPIAQQVVRH